MDEQLETALARLSAVAGLVFPERPNAPWVEVWQRLVQIVAAGPTQARASDSSPSEVYEENDGVVRLVTQRERDENNCAAVLAGLYANAKRGQYKEFAFAATPSDGDPHGGHFVWTRCSNQQRLIGQVALMQHALMKQLTHKP